MALTAVTGGGSIEPRKSYPAKSKDSESDSVAPESAAKTRKDRVDLKSEVTRANQSAQKSAQGDVAQQLLGRIDLSA
jgi:hypothetical protein